MPFAAAHSFHPEAPTALAECVGQLLEGHGPHPDLLVVLATNEHRPAWPEIGGAARSLLRPACQVGVVTASLIAGASVARGLPALSLWAAWGLEVAGAVAMGPHGDHRSGAGHGVADEGADEQGDRAWARAGGDTLDELVRGCGPAAALLVLATAEQGVERLVMELGDRHPDLHAAGAILPAAHTRLQLGGEDVPEPMVVVVVHCGAPLAGGGAPVAASMEVATSARAWPPADRPASDVSTLAGPGGPSDERPVPDLGPLSDGAQRLAGSSDAVSGDLVLDIFQRRARAALVFDSGSDGNLAADLADLELPIAGLNGVRAIGSVVSPGFTRTATRAQRLGVPAIPVVPAIAVALFRDRSDTI